MTKDMQKTGCTRGDRQGQTQMPVNTDLIDDGTETMSVTTDGHPESSSRAASGRPKKVHSRPCTACGDMRHSVDLARCSCQHEYCRECLGSLFKASMLDESIFPPRCCRREIPIDANRLLLGSDLVKQFKKKSIEFSTSNRIYCHQPACSEFTPPSDIKDGTAQCPKCMLQTCTTCKGATHKDGCPADKALQQVLQVAQQEHWQRCPKCSTMIELNTGCYHMTCKCRAQFCYLCGAQWKTCQCVQAEEDRLYEGDEGFYDEGYDGVEIHGEGVWDEGFYDEEIYIRHGPDVLVVRTWLGDVTEEHIDARNATIRRQAASTNAANAETTADERLSEPGRPLGALIISICQGLEELLMRLHNALSNGGR